LKNDPGALSSVIVKNFLAQNFSAPVPEMSFWKNPLNLRQFAKTQKDSYGMTTWFTETFQSLFPKQKKRRNNTFLLFFNLFF
jgi:hypothetical protein